LVGKKGIEKAERKGEGGKERFQATPIGGRGDHPITSVIASLRFEPGADKRVRRIMKERNW